MVTTFSVEFTNQAADDLGEITKTVAQRILDKIRWLSSNTRSRTILNDDREVFSIANQLRPSCSFIQIDPEVVAHEQPDSGPRGDRTEKPFANVVEPRGCRGRSARHRGVHRPVTNPFTRDHSRRGRQMWLKPQDSGRRQPATCLCATASHSGGFLRRFFRFRLSRRAS